MNFRRETNGNIAIMTAVCLSAIMICVGVAIDMNRLHQVRQNLQDVSDSAALMSVVGSNGTKGDVEKVARAAVVEQTRLLSTSIKVEDADVSLDNNIVEVSVNADVPLMFGGVIGRKTMKVTTDSRATYSEGTDVGYLDGSDFPDASIVFVLDASGSMNATFGSTTRIGALKTSTGDLFDDIKAEFSGDGDLRKHLRTGVYAYNWGIRDEYSSKVKDGWSHTVGAIEAMQLGRATIPAQAMEAALKDLINEPKTGNGEPRKKVIVFMTDGEVDDHLKMNGKSSRYHNYGRDGDDDDDDDDYDDDDDGSVATAGEGDFTARTLEVCRQAQSKGIAVIAISMDAPESGRTLLQDCVAAGQLSESYYANTSTDEAFDQVLELLIPARTTDTARLID